MPRLDLVPIYISDRQKLLDRLSSELERYLQVEVHQSRPAFDPEHAFDKSRGQYNSTRLLRLLLDLQSHSADWILGVTSVDIFIPVLTFVFGEAQLDGKVAVVSIQRLRPEAYGLPPDEELLYERLLKEALHELGHCFGLVHCHDPDCVMHSSTYVEEIDLKGAAFCAECRASITKPVNLLHTGADSG